LLDFYKSIQQLPLEYDFDGSLGLTLINKDSKAKDTSLIKHKMQEKNAYFNSSISHSTSMHPIHLKKKPITYEELMNNERMTIHTNNQQKNMSPTYNHSLMTYDRCTVHVILDK